MKTPEKGVTWYTPGRAIIQVYFPEDKTVCQWCPFCRGEDSLKRHKCLLTGEYLVYPLISIGNQCPIVLEEATNGNYRKC